MNILDQMLIATNHIFLHSAIGSMLSLRPVLISSASLQIIDLNAIVETRIIVLTYGRAFIQNMTGIFSRYLPSILSYNQD